MNLPLWLLRLLPMWEHICPACRRKVAKNSHECPHCGEKYSSALKVPSRILKNRNALEEYVHKHVFPRVDKLTRAYLTQFFTEFLNSSWEDSGGSDVTDDDKWDGSTESGSGTITVSDVEKYSGVYSVKVHAEATSDSGYIRKTLSSIDAVYARCYVYFDDLSLATWNVLDFLGVDTGGSQYSLCAGAYNDNGTYKFCLDQRENYAQNIYNSGVAISEDKWYCVEIFRDVTNNIQTLWVNDEPKIENSNSISTDATRCISGIRYLPSNDTNNLYIDSVIVADAYIGLEGVGLVEVTDVLGLSDSLLRHKPVVGVSDGIGASDAVLGDKNLLVVADAVSLSGFVEVIAGAVIKTVSDVVNVADLVSVNKPVVIADAVAVLGVVFRNKPVMSVLDVISVMEAVLASKLLSVLDSVNFVDLMRVLKTLQVSDAVVLVDAVSTPSRVLQALDTINLADTASVNKTLVVSESVSLVEVVEVSKGAKKTKLFLIIGDLAVQLTGD